MHTIKEGIRIGVPLVGKKKGEEEVSIELGKSVFAGLEGNIESPSPFLKDEEQDIFSELESQLEEDYPKTQTKEKKEVSNINKEVQKAFEEPAREEKITPSAEIQQKTAHTNALSSFSSSSNSLDERIAAIKKELGLI